MHHINRRQASLAALALLPALHQTATAQTAWPSKSVRVIVPFAPGGATDTTARLIAERLSQRLGQPFVIDNKPGAATVIGVDLVAKAPADGYTLLVAGGGSYSSLPALRSNLPFDVNKDLAPISLLSTSPVVLVTPTSTPYRRLADFVAAAKAQPGKLRYSTFGPGSAPHLAGEMLEYAAGISMEPIAYKGAADAAVALVRGDVDLGFETLSAASPQIKADKLRVLAVNSLARSSFLPDMPGMSELGYRQAAIEAFYGMAAPAGTPREIVALLSREIGTILALPEVRERMSSQFLEPTKAGPEEMAAVIARETASYKGVAARTKINLNQ